MKIARDIHDTLLQSIQALILRVHYAAQNVREGEKAREMLDTSLVIADRVLDEARERVTDLRVNHPLVRDLSIAIAGVGNELNADGTITFQVTTEGSRKSLRASVFEESFAIMREALTNAFRHSQGSQIIVTVTYTSRGLSVSCCDNGIGIDADMLDQGIAGHWGIPGMRERAKQVGATLMLTSTSPKGTEVTMFVHAMRAYELKGIRYRVLTTLEDLMMRAIPRSFRRSLTTKQ